MRTLFELVRISWAFRHRAWYRRFPFIPLPPKNYIEWRIETAYGENGFKNIRWNDIVAYARWHRMMRLYGKENN